MFVRHLYCDESGDFTDRHQPVLLGGVAVPRPSPRLGDLLRRAAEGVPWPLHAAHLNRASFAPMLVARRIPGSARLSGPVHQAAARLSGPDAPDAVQRCVVGEGKIDVPDLVVADDWLRRVAPALFEQVQRDAEDRIAAVWEVILGLPDAVVLAAWAPGLRAPESERYYELWDVLLERAAQLWGPGKGALTVTPASFPWATHSELRRSQGASPAPFPGLTVLVSSAAPKYGPDVNAHVVVADLVLNRLRHVLARGPRWSAVASSALPPVAERRPLGGPDLPAIAAAGPAAHAIRAAARLEVPPAPAGPSRWVPPWAAEQAEVWVSTVSELALGHAGGAR
jgi:hypothetical protein